MADRSKKELIKSYRDKARKRWQKLKEERTSHRKLSFAERRDKRTAEKQEMQDWLQKIKETKSKKSRRAQKKGFKLFKKLRRRRLVIGCWIGVVVIVVGLMGLWYYNVTRPLTEEQQVVRRHSLDLAHQEQAEGSVLLRNVDQVLPLKTNKINVFGAQAAKSVYGGGGAGGIAATDVVSLYDGLDSAGIEYNKELYNIYSNFAYYGKASDGDFKKPSGGFLATFMPNAAGFIADATDEMPVDDLPEGVLGEAVGFSNTAVYVVSRMGTETKDLTPTDLRLTEDESDILKKLDKNFENVVLLVNSTNPIELGFAEEMDNINAVLWIGAPGEIGMNAVADILTGDINPSGRLTDTYAYDIASNPAVVNTGSFQYNYGDEDSVDRYFMNYQEGIYVGYRYYETFVDKDKYDDVVQYPFGYGLSYTDFKWQVVDSSANADEITVKVKVTNDGYKAGKDVVEVYFSAPYQKGDVEKPAIELAAFAKTNKLQPGDSQTLDITFATNDMSSYDDRQAEAYVLDQGDYTIYVSRNVSSPVDSFVYHQPTQTVIDESVTGQQIYNRFNDARGDITYLSRRNPENTMPSAPEGDDLNMPDWVLQADYQHKNSDEAEPTINADNGLKLEDLKGLDYDDPQWGKFLDQFSEAELVEMAGNGGYWSIPIKRLGVPKTQMFDGPSSIRSYLHAWASVAYPIPLVLSSTWNIDLAEQIGEAMGEEAQSYNVDAVYAPSLNLHRSPLGGRSFEYFSEDPYITGAIGAAYIKGMQSTDTVAVMKHFVANDQETHRADYGLYTWLNEQSLRELYLKPFEMAVEDGDAHGAMTAFNRIGAVWAGGDRSLLTDVLRGEWGFEGFVITDAGVASQGEHFDALQAVEAGNDLMLGTIIDLPGSGKYEKQLKAYIKEDRAGTLSALRSAAHNICYYVLQTDKMK